MAAPGAVKKAMMYVPRFWPLDLVGELALVPLLEDQDLPAVLLDHAADEVDARLAGPCAAPAPKRNIASYWFTALALPWAAPEHGFWSVAVSAIG